jgi:hypothetical protein
MSADAGKNSDDKPKPPKNLSEIDPSEPESHDSGQNTPEPRRRSSSYASSAQTDSDSKSSNSDLGERSPTGSKSAALILFAIAADTTWRMFVPTLGGTALGLWADNVYHTEPWSAIGGLGLGIIITAVLIKQQYKKANDSV